MMIDQDFDKDYLTISELNQCIQEVIQAGIPGRVWVCGEIQGYNRNKTKKHIFFDLCEKDPETQDVLAKIGLVIFFNRKQFLYDILRESGNPFQLKDDIEVKFLCKVDFYTPHGAVRLIVENIDPAYTLGKIAAEKQRLIALLKKNGTLDKNKQTIMPALPLRIGLVTSYDSAAYNDFLSELEHSCFGFKVFYRNALMQGKGAEADICKALNDLYRLSSHFDVIVVTRGGGSIADLNCFDSQKIAEIISQSPIPVISGIGHEIDLSIADLAAYTYQKTPTAVAQMLVACVEEVLADIDESGSSLMLLVQEKMRDYSARLKQTAINFQQGIYEYFKVHRHEIVRLEEIIGREPLRILMNRQQALNHARGILLNELKMFFKHEHRRIDHAQRLVDVSDPKNIFKKGFSVTRKKDGALVRSIKDITVNEKIKTHVIDGVIESIVDDVNRGD